MPAFRAKDVFRQAREAEEKGQKKIASALYVSVGVHLRKTGKWREAKAIFDRSIDLSPDSPRIYLQLALCEVGLGNVPGAQAAVDTFTRLTIRKNKIEKYGPYLEAELADHPVLRQRFYEAALEVDRTTAAPFLKLAKALVEQKDHEGALKILLDGLKTKTLEDKVIAGLQYVLTTLKRSDALEHLERFTQGNLSRQDLIVLLGNAPTPKEPRRRPPPLVVDEEKNLNTLIRDLEAEMGIDLREEHDSVGALVKEFRQRSQKILQGDSKARIDMALAFFEMGLYSDARSELEPIVATDPFYLEGQCLLGEIFLAEGSDIAALEVYQQVLRDERAMGDLASEAKYKLVQIYFRLGDMEQALTHARELEKKAPEYRDIRRLRFQVQEALGEAGERTGSRKRVSRHRSPPKPERKAATAAGTRKTRKL